MTDFPNAPEIGDVFETAGSTFQWDGVAWFALLTEQSSGHTATSAVDADFPDNPQVGDQFSFQGVTWIWDGSAWVLFDVKTPTFLELADTPPNYLLAGGHLLTVSPAEDGIGFTPLTALHPALDARYARLAFNNVFSADNSFTKPIKIETANVVARFVENDQPADASSLQLRMTNGSLAIDTINDDLTNQTLGVFVFDRDGGASTDASVLRRDVADERYRLAGESGSITSGPAFPENPEPGDLHYRTVETAGLYVFFEDEDSTQWVQTNGGGGALSQEAADFLYLRRSGGDMPDAVGGTGGIRFIGTQNPDESFGWIGGAFIEGRGLAFLADAQPGDGSFIDFNRREPGTGAGITYRFGRETLLGEGQIASFMFFEHNNANSPIYIMRTGEGVTLPSTASVVTREKGDARYLQLTGGTLTGTLALPSLTNFLQFERSGSGGAQSYRFRTYFSASAVADTLSLLADDNFEAARFDRAGEAALFSSTVMTREKGDARFGMLSRSNTFTGSIQAVQTTTTAWPQWAMWAENAPAGSRRGRIRVAASTGAVGVDTLNDDGTLQEVYQFERDGTLPSVNSVVRRSSGDVRYSRFGETGPINLPAATQFIVSGIPDWANTIELIVSIARSNAAGSMNFQLGTSAGTEATGYIGNVAALRADTPVNPSNITVAVQIAFGVAANATISGVCRLSRYSNNTWMSSSVLTDNLASTYTGAFRKTMTGGGGILDRVRFYPGAGSFTGGGLNVRWWS